MAGFRTLKPLRTRGPAREWLAVREGERGFRRLCSLRFARAEDSSVSDTLLREAACMARLHHPTILPVFDFLSVEDQHVLVLAFEGVFSLERVTSAMRRQPVRFEMQAALFVAHALFDALAHAHHKFDPEGHPVTHGDVHPSHLILCKDGHVLVRGFCGVHPRFARDDADPYAAPERQAGHAASPSSDLYSASAIAWELLAGRGLPPGLPPPVSEVCPGAPAEVAAVLDTCLSIDPALRCIRAGTVAATLRRAADLHEGQECLKRLHARVLRRLPASIRAVSSGTLPPRTPQDASSPTRRFLRHRPRAQALIVGHPGHPLRSGSRSPERDDLTDSVIPTTLTSLPSIPDTSLVDVDACRDAIDDDSPTLRTNLSVAAWDDREVPAPDDDTLVHARTGSRTSEPWGKIASSPKPPVSAAPDPFAPTEPALGPPVPLQPLSFPPVAADPDESSSPRFARNIAVAVAISLLLAPAAWWLGRHGMAQMRAPEPRTFVAHTASASAAGLPLATVAPRAIVTATAHDPDPVPQVPIALYQTRLIVDGPPNGVVYVNGVAAGKTGAPSLTRGCGLRFVRVGTEQGANGVTWLSKGQTERLPCGETFRIRVRR